VIQKIEAGLSEAEATLLALEAERENLLYAGSEQDRADHAEQIREAEELAKNLRVALSGARKRRSDVAKLELEAERVHGELLSLAYSLLFLQLPKSRNYPKDESVNEARIGSIRSPGRQHGQAHATRWCSGTAR